MREASTRSRQMAELIKREIAVLMKVEINDPRLEGVVITTVDLSPDLKNAKVYFTLASVEGVVAASDAFKKAAGFIRHSISEKVTSRTVPKLHFIYDEMPAHANHLLHLIDSVQPSDHE